MINSSIGKRIRQYRESRSMKQEELAEKTDLSTTYIGMVERGERVPSLETFVKIANALSVSADLLLSDVLKTGYKVKSSKLTEQIEKLSEDERIRIYEVVDTMVRLGKNKK